MSSESPIGLSRLRGGNAAVREEALIQEQPRVSGWNFGANAAKAQDAPISLGRMSLVKQQDPALVAEIPKKAAVEAAPVPTLQVAPQVTPLDKGAAMEVMLQLSNVLLKEADPAARRQQWQVIRQQLDNLLQ